MLSTIIVSVVAGIVVYLIFSVLDRTPNKRHNQLAILAGVVVGLLVYLARSGISL